MIHVHIKDKCDPRLYLIKDMIHVYILKNHLWDLFKCDLHNEGICQYEILEKRRYLPHY